MHSPQASRARLLKYAGIASLFATTLLLLPGTSGPAHAEALLVVEADTGKVVHAENATYPWYPASVTKLMTAYVTLKAVKDGRITLDTLFSVSPVAAAQQPSKMGFKSGTQLTVDNALKMVMVKSANDMAVVLAEGVSGSVENFSSEMNKTALRLGMTQTNYVNPNGLPAEGQVTSARDLAILARAIIRDLPEHEYYFHIPAIKFGRRVTRNFNSLMGRYPGADGMKTGFICASGFNLVATATRDGKRLIAVVLGAQSSAMRAVKAATILERGFSGSGLSWLRPSLGSVDALVPINAAPPNLRDDMCGPKRKRPGPESDDDNVALNASGETAATGGSTAEGGVSLFTAGLQPGGVKPSQLLSPTVGPVEPVIVYTGPKKTGAELVAAVAVESEKQKPKVKRIRQAKPKPDAKPKADVAAKPDSKPAPKPVAVVAPKPKPSTPAAKPAPQAAAAATGVKPAPKPSARPAATRGASQKDGAKSGKSTDAKPAAGPKTAVAPRT